MASEFSKYCMERKQCFKAKHLINMQEKLKSYNNLNFRDDYFFLWPAITTSITIERLNCVHVSYCFS